MQLSFSTAIVFAAFSAVATLVAAQSCVTVSEATEFGVITVTPSTLAPGENFTVSANFTCSSQLGIYPEYTDYYIEVPENNNGHEPAILLARRTLSAGSLVDSFTTQLPFAYYYANSSYMVALETTYPTNGTNGSPYYVVGGSLYPITLTLGSSE